MRARRRGASDVMGPSQGLVESWPSTPAARTRSGSTAITRSTAETVLSLLHRNSRPVLRCAGRTLRRRKRVWCGRGRRRRRSADSRLLLGARGIAEDEERHEGEDHRNRADQQRIKRVSAWIIGHCVLLSCAEQTPAQYERFRSAARQQCAQRRDGTVIPARRQRHRIRRAIGAKAIVDATASSSSVAHRRAGQTSKDRVRLC
jgi:hypothetical protein